MNKKIIHFVAKAGLEYGGPSRIVEQLTRLGVHYHLDSVVLSYDSSEMKFLKGVHLPLGSSKTKYNINISGLLKAIRVIYKSDACVVHGLWSFHVLFVTLVSFFLNKKMYIFPHGGLDPYFDKNQKLKKIIKFLIWVCIERWSFRFSNGCFFTNESEYQNAVTSRPFFKCKKVILPLGVEDPTKDKNQFDIKGFRKEIPGLGDKPYLLFLSRLHPKKGLELILESLVQIKEYFLVVIGTGEESYVQELKNLSSRLGLEGRVFWLGMIDGDKKWAAYSGAELFLLPSHQENFGIVVCEALALSCPVLISQKIDFSNLVFTSMAGLICDDDVNSLVQSLKQWSGFNLDKRNHYRKSARSLYLKEFRIEFFLEKFHKAIYD